MEGLRKFKTEDAVSIFEDFINVLPALRSKLVNAGFPVVTVDISMGDTEFIENASTFEKAYDINTFCEEFRKDKEKILEKEFCTYVFINLMSSEGYWSPRFRIYFDSAKGNVAAFDITAFDIGCDGIFNDELSFGELYENSGEEEFEYKGKISTILRIFNKETQVPYGADDITCMPFAPTDENEEYELEYLQICLRGYNTVTETRDISAFMVQALEFVEEYWAVRLMACACLPIGDPLRDEKFISEYLSKYKSELDKRIKEWEDRTGKVFGLGTVKTSLFDAADMM